MSGVGKESEVSFGLGVHSTQCSCTLCLAGCGSCYCGEEMMFPSVEREVLSHSPQRAVPSPTRGVKPMSEPDVQAQSLSSVAVVKCESCDGYSECEYG